MSWARLLSSSTQQRRHTICWRGKAPFILIGQARQNSSCFLINTANFHRHASGLVMTGELGGWNQAIGASPYNDRWKHMRRLFHNAIGTSAANKRFDQGKETEA